MSRSHLFTLSIAVTIVLLAGCAPAAALAPTGAENRVVPHTGTTPEETLVTQIEVKSSQPTVELVEPLRSEDNGAGGKSAEPVTTRTPAETPNAPDAKPTVAQQLPPPERWKEWPVFPASVSEELREIYQKGLEQGNDPHAFSVLGDCQSQPEVFMGVYDQDAEVVQSLPGPLQETVRQFSGSFDRYSPTVKDGTTEGALLWIQWNDNKEKKCNYGETPIDCELRVHKPSIVFIHIGTHYEARNRKYLSTIIDKLLEHGAVPILVTKADNRELDERVNETMVSLADEYDLPLWNFWSSVQSLPDHGMDHGSDTYLSEDGLSVHRLGALQALDAVWRAVNSD